MLNETAYEATDKILNVRLQKGKDMKLIDIENVLSIFNLKKELLNYCKTAKIYQRDFVAFISTCKSGITEDNYSFILMIRYQNIYA